MKITRIVRALAAMSSLPFALTATVSAACAQGGAPDGGVKGAPAKAASAAVPSNALRLKVFKCDDVGIGCTAFTMLIPAEWKTEGGVAWQMQYSNLATGKMRIFNPKGAEALELFPIIPYTWDTNGIAFFPPGSVYMGNFVAAPPRDPEAFVREYVIGNFRQRAKNLSVVKTTPLPDVEKAILSGNQEAGVQKATRAAKVRITYLEGEKAIEEDIYCAYTVSRSPQFLPTAVMWMPDRLFAFRAEKGKLDALEGLLLAMLSSFRIELSWWAGYMQVVQLYRSNQMQSIKNAGDISRRISKNNDEIIAMNRAAWKNQQASTDRVMERFSDSIRGVERYDNPFERRQVELPSGYHEVWASPSGEYILSNDTNFNPSVGTNVDWRRIDKKE